MDIKEQVEALVGKIKGDSGLLEKFKKAPADTVKSLVGGNIPDDVIEKLASGIKGKLAAGNLNDAIGSVTGLFKNSKK